MKKVILALLAITTFSVNANALSSSRSREEARFLTDKMVYELNLTDDQADDVYEINYDYFRTLGPINEAYDIYWQRRYDDLSYVLYDWQWEYFLDREYFVRPAYIYRGGWAFGIYNYYAHTHFFYGLPRVYHIYAGGHYHTPHYYRDNRFHMHRRAVAAMPRPAVRRGGNMAPMQNGSRGGRPEMNRGNRSDMNRMGNGGNRMDNRGGMNRMENPGSSNRIENRGGMNRMENRSSSNRVENRGNMGNQRTAPRREMNQSSRNGNPSMGSQRSSTRPEARTERSNSSSRQSMSSGHREAPSRSVGGGNSHGGSRSQGSSSHSSRGGDRGRR